MRPRERATPMSSVLSPYLGDDAIAGTAAQAEPRGLQVAGWWTKAGAPRAIQQWRQ